MMRISSRTPRTGPPSTLDRFRTLYGNSPVHLVGHLTLILVAWYVLSVMFQMRFAPRPWNLVLWLVGGAVVHDAVVLPLYGVANTLLAKALRAGNGSSIREAAFGAVAPDTSGSPPRRTRDSQRRVPVLNHVRTPIVIAGVLLVCFLPRIAERQPQNFVNALGHGPPDYFSRWIAVSFCLAVSSAALYAIRWMVAVNRQPSPDSE